MLVSYKSWNSAVGIGNFTFKDKNQRQQPSQKVRICLDPKLEVCWYITKVLQYVLQQSILA